MKSSLESGRVIQLTVVRHEGSRGRVVVSWTAATAAASASTAVTLQPLSGTVCHSASFYTFHAAFVSTATEVMFSPVSVPRPYNLFSGGRRCCPNSSST